MLFTFQFRRGTAAEWVAANPILAQGEPGLETDTNKIKYGNGVTRWNLLAYFAGGGEGTLPDVPFGSNPPTSMTTPFYYQKPGA